MMVIAIGPQKMLRASGIMPRTAASAVSATGRAANCGINDGAIGECARDAETEIGFVPRRHHTDEFASRILVCEVDPLHLHRTLELGGGGGGASQLRQH